MSQRLLSELEKLSGKIPNTNENKALLQSFKLKILEKEANLDMLVNQISEVFFQGKIINDAKGNPINYTFLRANEKFQKLWNLKSEDIIGKTVLELFPNIEKSWIKFFGEVALTQKVNSKSHFNPDTNKRYVASAYSHKKGEFTALFDDISRELELKLKTKEESDKLNADILANMGEGFLHGIVINDKNGEPYDIRILQANNTFQIQTGVDGDALIGKTILEFFPNIKRHWLNTFIEVGISQVPKSIVDYGKITGRHYSINSFSPRKGQVISIFKDITELEEEKLKLKKSESLKTKIIEHMMDGFIHSEIICDANNEPVDYRILDVNPAFIAHTEIQRKDIVGKTMLEFFPDVEDSWIKLVGKVGITGEAIKTSQYNHDTKKHYEINAYSPVKGQVVKIFRDVTKKVNERIQLEKAYKRAEENERLKSAFLANMSHEIRTPMNGILGCAALLEKESLGKEERNKCLDYIKSSGNRLMRLISDIVDLSKIDAFEQELRYADHDLKRNNGPVLYTIPSILFQHQK